MTLGNREYALEHTRIESFPKQIETSKHFWQLVGPVEDALSGRLPGSAYYWLQFPSEPSLNVPKPRLEKYRGALGGWMLSKAPRLYERAAAALTLGLIYLT